MSVFRSVQNRIVLENTDVQRGFCPAFYTLKRQEGEGKRWKKQVCEIKQTLELT
jgi:hypothetical protein